VKRQPGRAEAAAQRLACCHCCQTKHARAERGGRSRGGRSGLRPSFTPPPRPSPPAPREPPSETSARPCPPPSPPCQVDNETYGTSTRKFLTAVPLVLFVLATHGTDFRKQPLGLNLLVVLVLLIAKLPYLHRVRFFGIGA
jgi:hypothetical protein